MLLICWFFNFKVLLDPKIQSNRLQITVDLLILYWVSSQCLSIDSTFCCWFVDFSIWSFLYTKMFRVTGCRTLLILSGFFSKSRSINSAFSRWFVDFVNDSLWQTRKFRGTGCRSLLICWLCIGFLLRVWVLIARFAVDLLIFQFGAFDRPEHSE